MNSPPPLLKLTLSPLLIPSSTVHLSLARIEGERKGDQLLLHRNRRKQVQPLHGYEGELTNQGEEDKALDQRQESKQRLEERGYNAKAFYQSMVN